MGEERAPRAAGREKWRLHLLLVDGWWMFRSKAQRGNTNMKQGIKRGRERERENLGLPEGRRLSPHASRLKDALGHNLGTRQDARDEIGVWVGITVMRMKGK